MIARAWPRLLKPLVEWRKPLLESLETIVRDYGSTSRPGVGRDVVTIARYVQGIGRERERCEATEAGMNRERKCERASHNSIVTVRITSHGPETSNSGPLYTYWDY